MPDRRPEVLYTHHHGMHASNDPPETCIYVATPADLIAAVRRGVESGEIEGWVLIERDRIRYCPFCGRLVERENLDDEMCLPTNCEAWKVKAKFNHQTREWEDGSD